MLSSHYRCNFSPLPLFLLFLLFFPFHCTSYFMLLLFTVLYYPKRLLIFHMDYIVLSSFNSQKVIFVNKHFHTQKAS